MSRTEIPAGGRKAPVTVLSDWGRHRVEADQIRREAGREAPITHSMGMAGDPVPGSRLSRSIQPQRGGLVLEDLGQHGEHRVSALGDQAVAA